jgi:hypothetical protein
MKKIIAKKIRKEVRRELKGGMAILNTMIHKRPSYIPKFIWLILYLPLFKIKTWKILYENI